MKKLKIGIDCDGVLRDFDKQITKLALEHGVKIKDKSDWEYKQKLKKKWKN